MGVAVAKLRAPVSVASPDPISSADAAPLPCDACLAPFSAAMGAAESVSKHLTLDACLPG